MLAGNQALDMQLSAIWPSAETVSHRAAAVGFSFHPPVLLPRESEGPEIQHPPKSARQTWPSVACPGLAGLWMQGHGVKLGLGHREGPVILMSQKWTASFSLHMQRDGGKMLPLWTSSGALREMLSS